MTLKELVRHFRYSIGGTVVGLVGAFLVPLETWTREIATIIAMVAGLCLGVALMFFVDSQNRLHDRQDNRVAERLHYMEVLKS